MRRPVELVECSCCQSVIEIPLGEDLPKTCPVCGAEPASGATPESLACNGE